MLSGAPQLARLSPTCLLGQSKVVRVTPSFMALLGDGLIRAPHKGMLTP